MCKDTSSQEGTPHPYGPQHVTGSTHTPQWTHLFQDVMLYSVFFFLEVARVQVSFQIKILLDSDVERMNHTETQCTNMWAVGILENITVQNKIGGNSFQSPISVLEIQTAEIEQQQKKAANETFPNGTDTYF